MVFLTWSAEDTNWVGLVYCNGTANLPNNTWLCNHPDNCGKGNGCDDKWDPELQKLPPTQCKDLDQKYKAFDAPVRGTGVHILRRVLRLVPSLHNVCLLTTFQ